MERRGFLKAVSSSLTLGVSGCKLLGDEALVQAFDDSTPNALQSEGLLGLAPSPRNDPKILSPQSPTPVATRIEKARNFNQDFTDDIFIDPKKIHLLHSTHNKLLKVRKLLGYGHFNLVSFDECIGFCNHNSQIAPFTKDELDFLEDIFNEQATRYGFYGKKVLPKMTAEFRSKDTQKIPGTGHYLFKGEAVELYNKIRKEIGSTVILTSGIRGIVKQMQLFLAKTVAVGGNLSRASRSLAPPGHSYHGIGDFDVGKIGLGKANFTNRFASTLEYKKLIDSGYVNIRYTEDNPFGVRYEPWHVKVIDS